MKRKLTFILCLGFIFTLITSIAKADVEQRRSELVKVLDEELREVTRLNKLIGTKRPDLMLRMAQILLEKGRILKDLENQKFLEIPANDRGQTNKEDFFK